jgi:nucleoside-diphosphate-sugar epimerase
MKVAITGHTQGLGQAFFKNFQDHSVLGFSRSNGYNISNPFIRAKILDQIQDADLFINNAYNNYDDSQLLLLTDVYNLWKDTDKIIVNISSRYTTGPEKYCKDKEQQDIFCKSKEFTLPYIINLKPGLVDTHRVKHINGNRLTVNEVVDTLNYILQSTFRIHSITFGKIND